MTFNTPVLLIAWRRPHTTQQVINAIRAVKPTRMFVACDGPNPSRPEEAAKVRATREVIEREIDWPCTIERRYSEVNQGCKVGVSSAINWFFDQVDDGIILEDDCVPHPDFFNFCQDLLAFYADDQRIWQISGCLTISSLISTPEESSYFFSRYGPIWGWATWKRAWKHYDSQLKNWPLMVNPELIDSVYLYKPEKRSKLSLGNDLFRNKIDTWDYQWGIIKNFNSALSITPSRNLIENVGFGKDAAHTKSGDSPLKLGEGMSFPLKHPLFVFPYENHDKIYREKNWKFRFLPKVVSLFRTEKHSI
jgi:hypothetical protein